MNFYSTGRSLRGPPWFGRKWWFSRRLNAMPLQIKARGGPCWTFDQRPGLLCGVLQAVRAMTMNGFF